MRTILILVLSLGLILTADFFLISYLNASTEQLTAQLNGLEKRIEHNDWQAAKKDLNRWQDNWTKIQNSWTLFIDHQEIDNIELSLNRMQSYIHSQNEVLSLGELSALKYWIAHIPDKESLHWGNIF
ncbi:MAG: DUF4363 family protein [bacterium]